MEIHQQMEFVGLRSLLLGPSPLNMLHGPPPLEKRQGPKTPIQRSEVHQVHEQPRCKIEDAHGSCSRMVP